MQLHALRYTFSKTFVGKDALSPFSYSMRYSRSVFLKAKLFSLHLKQNYMTFPRSGCLCQKAWHKSEDAFCGTN